MSYCSGSQSCSSRYPSQGSDYVSLPSIFCVVKKATSYSTEQHCGFRSSLPPEESHITPNLPPVWEPLSYCVVALSLFSSGIQLGALIVHIQCNDP